MHDLDNHKVRPRAAESGPASEDLAWESELVLLLSNLECQRVRLAEACASGHAVVALDAMLAMADTAADFVTARPDGADPDGPLAEAERLTEAFRCAVRRLRGRLERNTFKSLWRLFKRSSDDGDPHAQFAGCAEDLVAVLTAYFSTCTGRFRSRTAARAWHDTHLVFLADLRGLVDQLQP